ncbi:hypothetical protein B0T19DRAFT_185992 [Cercophora scortea]|uniref:Uncharacterized protein n=1 Tax=Cercophora scortea TaxID=314031 RepID=A0AAE0ME06_9PEZI|nr:hypothetical protein B0T19DRAFT_185992 [Cercophora scortea]
MGGVILFLLFHLFLPGVLGVFVTLGGLLSGAMLVFSFLLVPANDSPLTFGIMISFPVRWLQPLEMKARLAVVVVVVVVVVRRECLLCLGRLELWTQRSGFVGTRTRTGICKEVGWRQGN